MLWVQVVAQPDERDRTLPNLCLLTPIENYLWSLNGRERAKVVAFLTGSLHTQRRDTLTETVHVQAGSEWASGWLHWDASFPRVPRGLPQLYASGRRPPSPPLLCPLLTGKGRFSRSSQQAPLFHLTWVMQPPLMGLRETVADPENPLPGTKQG